MMHKLKTNFLYIGVAVFLFFQSCGGGENKESEEVVEKEKVPLTASKEELLQNINLPKGFKIEIYVDSVDNARSMALSPGGVLYVGNRSGDKVYALRDTNGDGKPDEKIVITSGKMMPNGVAFRGNDLFVAEVNRILKFENIDARLDNIPEPVVVYDQYPSDRHHGWKYIAFGPDGKLYVPVGAPCNICESENEIYATITRLDVDTKEVDIFARGVRNTVGFDWHPVTKELWFTDNGRDMMGDDIPPCELNHAPEQGLHFGYPYWHGGDIKDPEFGDKRPNKEEFRYPAQNLGPHTAPLGMLFYTGDMFPEKYKNQILIPEHGSWNRSQKIGYRITMVTLEGDKAASYDVFADGWLDEEEQEAWGRPVHILQMPDGSILVSDDHRGTIFRIYYQS